MTKEVFEAKFGEIVDPADLDRANCTLGGTCGHSQCGLCEHGTPKFLKCEACKADLAKYAEQLAALIQLAENDRVLPRDAPRVVRRP